MLKCLVLSDLHLVREGRLSLGIDSAWQLEQAVAIINSRHADADVCLVAGDLVDRGSREVYQRVQERLSQLTIPYHITLGNHDERESCLSVFGATQLCPETDRFDRAIDCKGYRVLLLDSTLNGLHAGRLEPAQLAWVRDRLVEASGRPVIVVLHHHVAPLHTPVDTIRLQNADELVGLLQAHGQVRQIVSGHVHLCSTTLWHGMVFTTLAGGHYSVNYSNAARRAEAMRLKGPAQLAVVLADEHQVTVHFDNYVDAHEPIG